LRNTIAFLILIWPILSTTVHAADLTVGQQVTAAQMRDTVLAKAVTQRIVELCADFTADEAKLSARRDAVMAIAKTMFPSGKVFMEAAGINETAKFGEDLRRFFLDRGVEWNSPSKKYCELAHALKAVGSPFGDYLSGR